MRGVINSEINPSDLVDSEVADAANKLLYDALKEPDYLISLLQKHFFEQFKYDVNGRFDDISPNAYREVINGQLKEIEDKVWKALVEGEVNMKKLLVDFGETNVKKILSE